LGAIGERERALGSILLEEMEFLINDGLGQWGVQVPLPVEDSARFTRDCSSC